MKRFARLQSRRAVPGAKSCLHVRTSATKPQTHANSETADADKPGPDDFIFDGQFEVNVDNKTIETAAGSLPISPLLDPTWREARNRVTPKDRPDKSKLNRFQRLLYQNPYAQLLATPVRSCYVTRTRVPGAFLQSFGLVKHPETSDVWWIPEYITQHESESPAPGEPTEAEGSQSASTGEETAPSSDAAPVDAAPAAAETKKVETTKPKKILQYPSHVLARQDLLQGFLTNGSKYRGGHFRLASNPRVSGLAKSAVWREDMDSAIVDLSRRQIMHSLLYFSRFCEGEQKRKYMFRVSDAAETQRYVRRWCFLWLGEATDQTAEAKAHNSASGPGKVEEGPGQYATLDIDGIPDTTRPIYNLPRLLGPDNVQRLRSESSILRDGSLFLLRGQRSLQLNQRLWRLQGYIADYSKLKTIEGVRQTSRSIFLPGTGWLAAPMQPSYQKRPTSGNNKAMRLFISSDKRGRTLKALEGLAELPSGYRGRLDTARRNWGLCLASLILSAASRLSGSSNEDAYDASILAAWLALKDLLGS